MANEQANAALQDRPIRNNIGDKLDRGPFVASLVRALVAEERDDEGKLVGRWATGYVVGLTGRWGLGKSSVLNLTREKLGTMDRTIVAYFNPWLFKGRDELLVGFFNALRDAMGRSNREEVKSLVGFLDKYWGAISFAGHSIAVAWDFAGGAGTGIFGWKTWAPRIRGFLTPKPSSPDVERRALEQKIEKSKCAVVVLIDELDRVEDAEVREVAQLVKAVGDIRGVSYLVAYDQQRVVEALGRGVGEERRQSGENYLEKIIQHPIPLRPLFQSDTEALLTAALNDHGVRLDEAQTDDQKRIWDHLVGAIETPREVKRLIGGFAVLEASVRGEICAYDVLGYCWILTKSPSVREALAREVDELVSDPNIGGTPDQVRRILDDSTPDVVAILGEAAASQATLLHLLFPRLSREDRENDGDRLSRRRNLVRMLYLGDPPGSLRRNDVEELWGESDISQLAVRLRTLEQQGTLAPILDRLDDLLPALPESGDRTFWVALSRALLRQSDWISGPEQARELADDAANVLYQLARRDPERRPRLQTAIESLVDDGDLILVPWVLRRNLFAHGLTKHTEGQRGGESLGLEETQQLLERELPRYRNAVLDGSALRRVPTVEAMYVVANTNHWDEKLHQAFTSQLDSLHPIATFAALLVPPGYTASRESFAELFDADVVRARIEQLGGDNLDAMNPWVRESLRRMGMILSGRDPHFLHD
ncbi:MAG: KAP family NTPase [Novosphingobium sp.]|nr:KAP family NTPase [Novosphingobium sp.]